MWHALTTSAKIIVNLHIDAVAKRKLRRKAMQLLLAMCEVFHVFGNRHLIMMDENEADDAWIAVVDGLVACTSSCRTAVFLLSDEEASDHGHKGTERASDNFFCWSREGRSL